MKKNRSKAISIHGIRHHILTAAAAAAGALLLAGTAWGDASAMDIICAPSDVIFAGDGSMLVTDTYHKVVWSVKDGKSTLYAGRLSTQDLYGEPLGGYHDSARSESYFKEPWAIVPFLDGYAVSDPGNQVVRFIDTTLTRTAVGSGTTGAANGIGTAAAFSNPTGLAVDEGGSLYIADTANNRICKVDLTGKVTTYAADLSEPTGLCYQNGSLYIAESGNHRIIQIKDGQKTVIAGDGMEGSTGGPAAQSRFSNPQGVEVAEDGTIYVSDTGNSAIRRISGGQVTTLLVNNEKNMDMIPVSPMGMAIQGNTLYICDNFSKKIITAAR
ncbi:MAG: hypothetical protein PHV18_05300 [Lachnospiraceae bacterium]|nr:hypothetical protein [Lachnospiraceae bacterium]